MQNKLSLGLTVLSANSMRPKAEDVFDTDAHALFARMNVQPNAARKNAINTLITSLKSSGVWASLDYFYMLAAHTAQAARLNWVANDELLAVGAPVVTPDRGVKGDGVAAYLELPFNQASLAKAQQNNASWLLGVRSEGATNRFLIGAASAIRFSFSPAATGINVRNTQGASNDTVDCPRTGRFGSTRAGASVHTIYRNGSSVMSSSTPSVAAASSSMFILRGGTLCSDGDVTYCAGGAGLTPQQQIDTDAALVTYLTALGALY